MLRFRPLLLLLLGLVLLLLSRGVVRVQRSAQGVAPLPDGRSAQAARTDPEELVPAAPATSPAEREATRTTIRDAGDAVYLPTMFSETDSVIRRWSDADAGALRVAYIIADVPGWSPDDHEIARAAFHAWEQVGLPVRFVEVLDTADAQLIVRWVPRFSIDRSGQTDLSWDVVGRIHHAFIQLALSDSGGRALSADGRRAVALHEVGHALGLPHSDRQDDLMYPTTRRPVLTDRDIASMQLLYRLPPGSIK